MARSVAPRGEQPPEYACFQLRAASNGLFSAPHDEQRPFPWLY
jgi:hypothetical protein